METLTKERFKKKILVLEDDVNLGELILETLEDEGYLVELATSAEAALKRARSERFHLLLTDVRMAGSMDGVGALEAIQRLLPGIRSIVMTGYADVTVPPRAMRLQADDYLLKGSHHFGTQSLLRAVARVLDRKDDSGPFLGWLWERVRDNRKDADRLTAMFNPNHSALVKPEQAGGGGGSLSKARLDLESLRALFFEKFAVAIRSRHLSPGQAQRCWERVGMLDARLVAARTDESFLALLPRYAALEAEMLTGKLDHIELSEVFSRIERAVEAAVLDATHLAGLSLMRFDPHLAGVGDDSRQLLRGFLPPVIEPGSPLSITRNERSLAGRQLGKYYLSEMVGLDYEVTLEDGLAARLRVYPRSTEPRHLSARGVALSEDYLDVGAEGECFYRVHRPSSEPVMAAMVLPGGWKLRDCLEVFGDLFERMDASHREGCVDGSFDLDRCVSTRRGVRISNFGFDAEERGIPQRVFDTRLSPHKQYDLWLAPTRENATAFTAACDQFRLAQCLLGLLNCSPIREYGRLGFIDAIFGDEQDMPAGTLSLKEATLGNIKDVAPLRRMLSKDPTDRFPTLLEAKKALWAVAD